jgi:hypothetical protein
MSVVPAALAVLRAIAVAVPTVSARPARRAPHRAPATLPAVAQRSVRKARTREAQRAASAPYGNARAPSSKRARGPAFGALVTAAILIPLAVIAVLALGGEDEERAASEPLPTQSAGFQQEVERLRRESAARDKEQIQELTTRTRTMVDDFGPVIVGLGKTLPPGKEGTGPLAAAAEVNDWHRRVRDADEFFAETESGETATNVARNGFGNAVDVLLETVKTYKLALEEPGVRDVLLQRARSQRDLAARTWSTAATQLDAINIDAGFGHQHVTFPSSAGPGAVPPDSLPEGTDAETPGNR